MCAQPRVGTVERLDTALGARGYAAPCVWVLKQGLGFPWPCKIVGWEVLVRKLVARRASAEAQVILPAPSCEGQEDLEHQGAPIPRGHPSQGGEQRPGERYGFSLSLPLLLAV